MTTKNCCLSFKSIQDFGLNGTSNNNQYNNLKLNQNIHQSISNTILSKNEKISSNGLQLYQKKLDLINSNESQTKKTNKLWNHNQKNPSPNCLNLLVNFENKKLSNKSFSNASSNKSTLSLHISAYENYIEATSAVGLDLFDDKISKKKSFIASSLTVQNPFEFSRQQHNEPSQSSVMPFSCSQRLLNPNNPGIGIVRKIASAANKGLMTLEAALSVAESGHDPPDNVVNNYFHAFENFDVDDLQNDFNDDYVMGNSEPPQILCNSKNDLTEKEFTMSMLGKFIFSNFSVSKVKKEVSMDNLMGRETISSSEYLNFLSDVERRYGVKTQYFCPSCEQVLLKPRKTCVCGLKFSRGKDSGMISITTCAIRPQIIDCVIQNLKELSTPKVVNENRSQLNEFPQSIPEYHNGVRRIKLMINTDGIVPKQSFRGDIWPVYLAIADLETKSRGVVSNCLISSIICGFSKPITAMWKIALEPLRLEKIQLEQNCITIKDHKFTFSIEHGIFDFEAGVNIYDGVGHSSLGKGCLNCFVDPKKCLLANSKGKIPNKRLWPIEGEFEYRTDESILTDAENGTNGLKSVTPWMEIILPTKWRLDALHVLEEGILPRIMEPYFPKKDWTELNRVYFIESNFPSRCKLHPRSIMEFNRFNGGDKRCLFFTLFPLLLQYNVDENSLETSVYFLFWHVIRLLSSSCLNAKMIDDIIQVLPTIAKYFNELFPEELNQMKSHRFFLHLKDELLNYGTPYDFSTAFFEMINRLIKVGFNPFDTKSLPLRALTMMLARKDWISQVYQMPETSKQFEKIIKKLCPALDIRKIKYCPDDYVQFYLSVDDIRYGKILSTDNDTLKIELINGTNLIDYGDNDLTLPGDIRFAFFLFKQHVSFGIKVDGTGGTLLVHKSKILCHCCMFKDNNYSYMFSLDTRMAGK